MRESSRKGPLRETGPARFDGRVALVVGGARGIGAAVVELLACRGATTYCMYRSNDEAAARLHDRLKQRQPAVKVLLERADATVGEDVAGIFERIATEQNRLDILVNSAGTTRDGLLLRLSDADVRASLQENLESAIACSRAALGPMLRQRHGRIVNVGSVVASLGNAGQTAYAAAKAGLEGFTRALAREVGLRGITVNCVAPGLIDTELTAALASERRRRAVEATALGRAGTPAEVAAAIGFLCTEEAGYVTGTVLHVNGGMYM